MSTFSFHGKNPSDIHIHVIGICGVATGALAVAFHTRGYIVTGSDKGFWPPVSTELEKHKINFYAGWHPEKMSRSLPDGTVKYPDIIIAGTASGTQNPETELAKKLGLPIYSFAEAIGEFFAKENSIVCAGTWGKTSNSTLLSHILTQAEFDPTYMFGGISLSHNQSAYLGESKWSVFEGDEYKSSPTDTTPKFAYYRATHVLLTAVNWDHADLYPTPADFKKVFLKLAHGIPRHGALVACIDNTGVREIIAETPEVRHITYGKADSAFEPDYSYSEVQETVNGISCIISHGDQDYHITSPMLGSYQVENITACFAMAHYLGVNAPTIIAAIASFKGLKRRLEQRLLVHESPHGVTVIDDIAHSADKARTTIAVLKRIFNGKVTVVFEPNTGGRIPDALPTYANAFSEADRVIIPRLTKLKTSDDPNAIVPVEGEILANTIKQTQPNTDYISDDDLLVQELTKTAHKGDVIAFLGSHGFRKMIEMTVTTFLHQQ
jgi:UDP-N-acetylmuramate: L-alanyl-gamma-D-glutamyl-meso-diaminopimelate ligase